jgi:hypothetical protein
MIESVFSDDKNEMDTPAYATNAINSRDRVQGRSEGELSRADGVRSA